MCWRCCNYGGFRHDVFLRARPGAQHGVLFYPPLMKTFFLFTALLAGTALYAQTKASLKVSGNCSMCKERIEAAVDVAGVRQANWNSDTKLLELRFNPEKISLDSLRKRILAVGHDVDSLKADEAVYRKLHSCCQYER